MMVSPMDMKKHTPLGSLLKPLTSPIQSFTIQTPPRPKTPSKEYSCVIRLPNNGELNPRHIPSQGQKNEKILGKGKRNDPRF